jgi:nucleotide-binding universal stress UspA family protein
MEQKTEINRIIAATDFSECASTALSYATQVALRFSAELTVLHATPIQSAVAALPFSRVPLARAIANQYDAAVAALADYCDQRIPDLVNSWQLVVPGDPGQAILEKSRSFDADLVVMGTHGRSGLPRFLMGSVAEHVIRESDSPVLSVRSESAGDNAKTSFERIVCPVNYTAVAAKALNYALLFASAFDSELTVLYLVEKGVRSDELELEAERIRVWVGDVPRSIKLKLIVREGRPAQDGLEYVDEHHADLLVLGAKRKQSLNRSVLGTTTEELTRLAMCPVLTVPFGRVGS